MSSLWRQVPDGGWEPDVLGARLVVSAGVELVVYGEGSDRGVALLALPEVPARINGHALAGGLQVLAHRDEILIGRQRFYFSAESTPFVTVYRLPDETRRPNCPVCRGPLRDGERAVRCPGCARWYHQTGPEGGRQRDCFTYSPACRFCGHPTSLKEGTGWRPESEESRG